MTEDKHNLDNEYKISLSNNNEIKKDTDNNSINSDSSLYSIIQFKKIIRSFNKDNYIRLIREMSNGYILVLHNQNDISIYEKRINVHPFQQHPAFGRR